MTSPQPSEPFYRKLPAWLMKLLHAIASGAVASIINVAADAQSFHAALSFKTIWHAVVIGVCIRGFGVLSNMLDSPTP